MKFLTTINVKDPGTRVLIPIDLMNSASELITKHAIFVYSSMFLFKRKTSPLNISDFWAIYYFWPNVNLENLELHQTGNEVIYNEYHRRLLNGTFGLAKMSTTNTVPRPLLQILEQLTNFWKQKIGDH